MHFHLCPQKKYSLRWADFHYVQTFYTKFQPNQTIYVESVEQTSLSGNFHKTHNHWANFIGQLVYQILSKSDKNVENIGKMHLHLQENCSFHCTNFQDTQN
jgi:hypothetical protein